MSAAVSDAAWDLTPADRLLVGAKRLGNRLRFAVILLFFRARGRFPRTATEVDDGAVAALARALGVPVPRDSAALLPGGFCCIFSERSRQGRSRAWRDGIRRAR